MKKFLYLLAVLILVFFLPVTARAETWNGVDYEYTFTTTNASSYINQELKILSHYPFAFVRQDGIQSRVHLVTLVDVDNQYYTGKGLANLIAERNTTNGTASVVWIDNGTAAYTEHLPIMTTNNGNPIYQWSILLDPTPYTDTPIYDTYEDAYEALNYVEPTYYYDASIPLPPFSVFIGRLPQWSADTMNPTNFFDVTWGASNEYNIEIGYRFAVPSYITVGLSNGNVTYKAEQYYTSEASIVYRGSAINPNTYVDESDFTWSPYITLNIEDYFHTTVPVWANNWNNQAYTNARQDYIDKYSKCMPLYGNKIEIFARYYIEDDSNVYVGQWRQWNNTYPTEYTAVVPANYQPGEYAPGLTGPVQTVDAPETSLISGEVTGNTSPSNSVVINQAVPNYPDYPTAVSYNHDNLLLQWVQTSTQMPNLMGQFGSFLTSAFTFIPDSFWGVVSFGLLCCIGVMIVKVL